MTGRTARRRVLRVQADDGAAAGPGAESRADLLAVEEPLEIRLNGAPLTVTMRTPGDDIDLAAGFLAAEGVRRNFLTTSACGVCGKDSIDAIRVRARYDVSADPVRVSPAVLASLPTRLREAQWVFASTGGLHAAGLFRADGTLLALREDVGRHNAVDKLIGRALQDGRLPLAGHVLLVSGRASFELAQKALVAGVPLLAAVSAPSSLAVELADESGITLVGFLRGTTMNVHTGAHRLSG
jgi:FdhD protein